MTEVDIFSDLTTAEMEAIAEAAPMVSYSSGSLIHSAAEPHERLHILKAGRVRLFRLASDGLALTTAIVQPGTIFGEMVAVGQAMHDSYAEALDDVVVCVMTERHVRELLLADARIATRIAEILGRRVAVLEQRLTDTVFKSASERVGSTLRLLATDAGTHRLRRGPVIALTHEQIAALTGVTREATTRALGELAQRGAVRLGRGRVIVLDAEALNRECGD